MVQYFTRLHCCCPLFLVSQETLRSVGAISPVREGVWLSHAVCVYGCTHPCLGVCPHGCKWGGAKQVTAFSAHNCCTMRESKTCKKMLYIGSCIDGSMIVGEMHLKILKSISTNILVIRHLSAGKKQL